VRSEVFFLLLLLLSNGERGGGGGGGRVLSLCRSLCIGREALEGFLHRRTFGFFCRMRWQCASCVRGVVLWGVGGEERRRGEGRVIYELMWRRYLNGEKFCCTFWLVMLCAVVDVRYPRLHASEIGKRSHHTSDHTFSSVVASS